MSTTFSKSAPQTFRAYMMRIPFQAKCGDIVFSLRLELHIQMLLPRTVIVEKELQRSTAASCLC